MTGSFSRGLFVQSEIKGKYIFRSRDEKEGELIRKYGTEWQGLNDKTLRELEAEYLAPDLRREIINLIKR